MGGERLSDQQCLSEPGGGPSLVQSTKSDTPGKRGSWLLLCPRHRDNGGAVCVSGWGVRSKD